MIIKNNTARVIVIGTDTVLPGSNWSAKGVDLKKYPVLSMMEEAGEIELVEDPTERETVNAIRTANTQATVDEIAKNAKKSDKVSKAAKARKDELDRIDGEVAAAKQAKAGKNAKGGE